MSNTNKRNPAASGGSIKMELCPHAADVAVWVTVATAVVSVILGVTFICNKYGTQRFNAAVAAGLVQKNDQQTQSSTHWTKP